MARWSAWSRLWRQGKRQAQPMPASKRSLVRSHRCSLRTFPGERRHMEAMNPVLLLTLAVAVSMLIIPLGLRLAPHLGLMDMPDARKVHSAPIPRIGGWGIA